MKKVQFDFIAAENTKLNACLWQPDGAAKAVLQIAHGMTEHIGRYELLAQELAEKGIAVAGFDLRGHGKNEGDAQIASFGEGGWEKSLQDMQLFSEWIKERFSGVPRIWLGFSLGSFLLREYLNRCEDELAGAVIMGTGAQPGAVLSIMSAIVKGQIPRAGFDGTTPLVKKLSFETYNQKFKPNRTPSDWLCADTDELDQYREDHLCRKDISSGLFYELLCAMKRTGTPGAYRGWRKNMPVLVLSGGADPVGGFGKGVEKVYADMQAAGMEKAKMQLFAGARHDVLHEENTGTAMQVRALLADWILKITG